MGISNYFENHRVISETNIEAKKKENSPLSKKKNVLLHRDDIKLLSQAESKETPIANGILESKTEKKNSEETVCKETFIDLTQDNVEALVSEKSDFQEKLQNNCYGVFNSTPLKSQFLDFFESKEITKEDMDKINPTVLSVMKSFDENYEQFLNNTAKNLALSKNAFNALFQKSIRK
ncbi:hypothetical protein HDU92_001265 [Lobulomyces angularis]|nr:hypothetical protein HDU92_001265 [Lobulomyces angularis]